MLLLSKTSRSFKTRCCIAVPNSLALQCLQVLHSRRSRHSHADAPAAQQGHVDGDGGCHCRPQTYEATDDSMLLPAKFVKECSDPVDACRARRAPILPTTVTEEQVYGFGSSMGSRRNDKGAGGGANKNPTWGCHILHPE